MSRLDPMLVDFDHQDLKIRLRNAIRETGWDWIPFCNRHGIPHEGARQAVENCARDIEFNLDMLDRLCAALGRSRQWLFTGVDLESNFSVSLREKTRRIVDEFIVRAWVPDDDQPRLRAYVAEMIDSLQTHTPDAAYRRGLPQTWRDVAYLYDEMRMKNGY